MHYNAAMPSVRDSHTLLETLARRVRRLRRERSWTRDRLAQRSGLSVRFLARVEAGDGNISLLRLQSLAEALGTTTHELVVVETDPRRRVALVGLRGAGKSSVGPLLARRLGVRFLEMDALIVNACGLPLDQLFELHGEAYYRRLERDVLQRLISAPDPLVLAAGGGIVNDPVTWRMLREQTTVVWLQATPEEHWERVVGQGDRRPMADHPDAMEELRALWGAREKIYAQAALTIDTSGQTAAEAASRVEQYLQPPD